MKLGNLIFVQREKLGITQEELALRLDVTTPCISRWETNLGTPTFKTFLKLMDELGVGVGFYDKTKIKETGVNG